MNNNKQPEGNIFKHWTYICTLSAAIWAVGAFAYNVIYIPYSQTSFFVTTIELKQQNDILISGNRYITPIIVKITGKNNSKKTLSIASAYIQVWGDQLEDIKDNTNEKIIKSVHTVLDKEKQDAYTAKYIPEINSSVLFIGSLFKNWNFEPGELNSEEKIFYLPKGKFNVIEAKSFILSGPNGHDMNLIHTVDDDLILSYSTKDPKDEKKVLSFGDPKFMEVMMKNKIGKSGSNSIIALKL